MSGVCLWPFFFNIDPAVGRAPMKTSFTFHVWRANVRASCVFPEKVCEPGSFVIMLASAFCKGDAEQQRMHYCGCPPQVCAMAMPEPQDGVFEKACEPGSYVIMLAASPCDGDAQQQSMHH